MDDVRIFERKPNVATDKEVLFSLRNTPLLEQGTSYDPLATAENLWVNLKVYASGGENALHSHGGEDHAFIILQGKATFTFGDGRTEIVGKNQGVMLPKNAKYKFEADEEENLVMLRVGGGVRTETGLDNLTLFGTPKDVVAKTSFADGEVKVGNAPKNGESSKKRSYAPGKFFAAD
jgi:mannose-6-phosphate isomerase-like protein (cupin superfamily)